MQCVSGDKYTVATIRTGFYLFALLNLLESEYALNGNIWRFLCGSLLNCSGNNDNELLELIPSLNLGLDAACLATLPGQQEPLLPRANPLTELARAKEYARAIGSGHL